MRVQSVDYIVTNRHYSLQLGADGSMKDYLRKMADEIKKSRGVKIEMLLDEPPRGEPVLARIWQGQWIADCDICGGALFVNPDEPIYFCFGCTNRANGHALRPVKFPSEADRLEIEAMLLARPVDDMAGLTDLERVGLARPLLYQEIEHPNGTKELFGLARNWTPDETLDDLRQQNKVVEKWQKELKVGNNVKRKKK